MTDYVVIENENSVSSVESSVVYARRDDVQLRKERKKEERRNSRQNGRATVLNLDLLKAAFGAFGQVAESVDAPGRSSPHINLSFVDLSYSVKHGIRRETKCILKNLHGEFRSGELTAVMGPSGAGKSSLVNILAGFTTQGVTGTVRTNGVERDQRTFARQSCSIFQDDQLHPLLTVGEAMEVAAHLKLGPEVRGKCDRVNKILQSLGLYQSRKVMTGKLSGGQKKRLAIALEMVSNPPVMFFDEPTSGLDSSTSKQCIEFLKGLARSGKTVICTIHQPSASLFEMFDHVYTVQEGNCIYSGSTKGLVPFLAEQVLEVASMSIYSREVPKLVRAMDKGRVLFWRKRSSSLITPTWAAETPPLFPATVNGKLPTSNSKETELCCNGKLPTSNSKEKELCCNGKLPTSNSKEKELYCNGKLPTSNSKDTKLCRKRRSQAKELTKTSSRSYPTSFLSQLMTITALRFRMVYRDTFFIYLRLGIHLLVGLLLGIMLYDTGGDAAFVFKTFGLMFFSVMFIMFTNYSGTFSLFGGMLPILTREHFNKWYSLKSFFLAVDLVETPAQLVCTFLYTLIMYLMTSQPSDTYRFFMTFLVLFLNGYIAQGLGYIVGSATRVQDGPILGPLLIAPFIVFSGFFVLVEDAPYSLRWLFHISYFKYALEALMVVIYGANRLRLACSHDYCHFVIPSKFLQQIGMEDEQVWCNIAILVSFGILLRIVAYWCLSFRIQHIKK